MRAQLVLLFLVVVAACEGEPIRSSFGAYPDVPAPVLLASGDTLQVYRVKYWVFGDGSPPSLQLEYEAPLPISDTTGLREFALEVWPQFKPYVDSLSLDGAILSATRVIRHRQLIGWRADFERFGVVLDREEEVWSIRGVPLPPSPEVDPLRVIGRDGSLRPLLEGVPANPRSTFEFRLHAERGMPE